MKRGNDYNENDAEALLPNNIPLSDTDLTNMVNDIHDSSLLVIILDCCYSDGMINRNNINTAICITTDTIVTIGYGKKCLIHSHHVKPFVQ